MSLFNRRALLGLLAILLLPLGVRAETPAPIFSLPGEPAAVSLASLKGQVVYLDFWASWCTPCRQSFPWMAEMQSRYESQGLKVVAVNLDNERELAQRFLEENKAGFTVAYDDGSVAEQYGVQAMPSSYLIDRAGNIVMRHRGFRQEESRSMERAIRQLLEKGK